jgi:hypothetical protein
VGRIYSTMPNAEQAAEFAAAMKYERRCEKAYYAARNAKPFDKAAYDKAWKKLQAAIEVSKRAGR